MIDIVEDNKLELLMRGPSIDSYSIDKIKHATNTEVVRRLLIKYFMDKGFESFDKQMYPSIMQDLPMVVPLLLTKIEIIPHAREINSSLGKAVLGWNLFVLGNQRMYLGETYHNNLHDLARQIRSGIVTMTEPTMNNARRQTTPRRIITFITRVLSGHADGYVDLSPSTTMVRLPGETNGSSQSMLGIPQQFTGRSAS